MMQKFYIHTHIYAIQLESHLEDFQIGAPIISSEPKWIFGKSIWESI